MKTQITAAALATMTLAQLQGAAAELTGTAAGDKNKKRLLAKLTAIAAHNEAEAARVAEEAARAASAQHDELAPRRAKKAAEPKAPKAHDHSIIPAVGSTISHKYSDGRVCSATVLDGGLFEYNGKPYPTTSMIAREDAGGNWNGLVFFGLKPYPKKAARAKVAA